PSCSLCMSVSLCKTLAPTSFYTLTLHDALPIYRLVQTYRPEFRCYVEPPALQRLARRLETRLEFAPPPLARLARLLAWDSPLNPVRPLPPLGGLPRLHGIETQEVDVSMPLGVRVSHSLELGIALHGKECHAWRDI